MDMIAMQRNLKNNSEDISSYVSDLNSWQKDIASKDTNS